MGTAGTDTGAVMARRSGGRPAGRRTGPATLWLCLVDAGPPRQASCAPVPADEAVRYRELFQSARAASGAAAATSGAVGVLV